MNQNGCVRMASNYIIWCFGTEIDNPIKIKSNIQNGNHNKISTCLQNWLDFLFAINNKQSFDINHHRSFFLFDWANITCTVKMLDATFCPSVYWFLSFCSECGRDNILYSSLKPKMLFNQLFVCDVNHSLP